MHLVKQVSRGLVAGLVVLLALLGGLPWAGHTEPPPDPRYFPLLRGQYDPDADGSVVMSDGVGGYALDAAAHAPGFVVALKGDESALEFVAGGGGGAHAATHTNGTDNLSVSGGVKIAGGNLQADFGAVATTVCEGNDARLSDARTPTAHTHAGGDITTAVATATDADTLDSQHGSYYGKALSQGVVTLYTHTGGQSYHGVGKNNTIEGHAAVDTSATFTVDFDLVNTACPGGWGLYWIGPASTNGTAGVDTLNLRLRDETGVAFGTGTIIGTLTNQTIAAGGTSEILTGYRFGPFVDGTMPAAGVKVCSLAFWITSSTLKVYYTSDWTVVAICS
jgi:hypothetical protein